MNKDLWEKLNPLIDEALDLSPCERAAWLERVRHESPTIADEIENLLAREGTLDRRGFLATPPSIDSLVDRVLSGETAGYQRKELERALAPRYTLGPIVGRGGMATVYRGHDTRHDRDVAIKVIRPDAASAVGAQRFLDEIRLTAKLTHPNILPLLDSGESEGVLYYVMPFIDGESLRAHAARGAMTIDEIVRVLKSVTEALAYAHAQGAVHRDIKPDNVLISGRQVWLADFGIAKAMATSTSAKASATGVGGAVGSPGYMAPEQIEGRTTVDHRADLYSLGSMGWELLAGKPVFETDSVQELFRRHLASAPQKVSAVRGDVPPPLADAVMRCLAKSPDDRFQSADELLQQLEKSLRGTQLSPTTKVVLAAAVCAVVAAVGILVMRPGSGGPPATARRITNIGDVAAPKVSPDGKLVLFRRRADSSIWIQAVDSGIPTRIAESVAGVATWMDDSTVAVLGQPPMTTTRPILLRLPHGRDLNIDFVKSANERWISAGAGALYHVSRAPEDSLRLTLRRAAVSGWRDSVTVTLREGERLLWLTHNARPLRLAIGTRSSDSVMHVATVSPDGNRRLLYSVSAGDSMGYNTRLGRVPQPGFTPDGRFLVAWLRRDTLFKIDAGRPSVSPMIVAGHVPGLFTEQTHDAHIPVVVLTNTLETWRFPIPQDTARLARMVERAPESVLGALSPDGLMVARIERRNNIGMSQLVVSSQSAGTRRTLLTSDGLMTVPTWSPDGNRIALRLYEAGKTGQWIIVDVRDASITRFGTSPQQRRGSLVQTGFSPAWSPDGRTLYASDSAYARQVRKFALDVAGDTGIVVSKIWEGDDRLGYAPEGLVVSPDGSMLAVGGADMTVVPLDGRPARHLVSYDSLILFIPVAWFGQDVMYVTRDERGRMNTRSLAMRDIWMVSSSGRTAPRYVGVLPAGCVTSYTVLRGGTEASCSISAQTSDVWFFPPMREK